jgi:perosamine synthetase
MSSFCGRIWSDGRRVLQSSMPLNLKIPHSRPTLGAAEARAASDVVSGGYIGRGRMVRAFASALEQATRRRFGVMTDTGSAALLLTLKALGVGGGDEVVIPAFICRAVLNAVLASGARPILADIDPSDMTMDPVAARSVLTPSTKAVVVAHMFGAPAPMQAFASFPVPVVEDAASSIGAKLAGAPVGSFGVASILSFASTKMVTAGQGGAVLTDDQSLATRIAGLLDYDSDVIPNAESGAGEKGSACAAFNHQLTDVPASVGVTQLARLGEFLHRRRAIAERYDAGLRDLAGVTLPHPREGAVHAYFRYILTMDRDTAALASELQSEGLDARSGVAHFLPDYLHLPADGFPGASSIRSKLLSLPIFPSLTEEEITTVCARTRLACTPPAREGTIG